MVSLNIKKIRKTKNISQEELAIRVGCDRSYISKIENNKINKSITLHTLIQIVRALDVKPHEIFDVCETCEYKNKYQNNERVP